MQTIVVLAAKTFVRHKIKNIKEGLTIIRTAKPAIKVNLKIIR